MSVVDRATPYAERLLDDRELQRDLRELAVALKTTLGRAEKKKKKPARLLDDRKFKDSAQRAAAAIKDANARFQGKPPKRHRLRKFLVAVVLVGGAAVAAKQFLAGNGEGSPAS